MTPVIAEVLDGEAKRPIWNRIAAKAPLFDKFQSGAQRDLSFSSSVRTDDVDHFSRIRN
jgi:hypothetical protein